MEGASSTSETKSQLFKILPDLALGKDLEGDCSKNLGPPESWDLLRRTALFKVLTLDKQTKNSTRPDANTRSAVEEENGLPGPPQLPTGAVRCGMAEQVWQMELVTLQRLGRARRRCWTYWK